jgi:hypothetical protein
VPQDRDEKLFCRQLEGQDRKMKDRKSENHYKFDPLADHFSVLHLSVF